MIYPAPATDLLAMFFFVLLSSAFFNARIVSTFATNTHNASIIATPIQTTACSCPNQRSVWDITWSCLATVFACAWVAVHPDVPHPEARWWDNTRRRLELMFWTIITPELIVFWAARQWYGAREIEKVVSPRFKAKWTRTHAHFAQMGGFQLFDGKKLVRTLSIWDIQNLCSNGHVKFPKPSLRDIEDRSKSDALAKVLVVGQTTWFIIQIIARAVQGLVVTEIEIATLAFAALNAIMYFFWWDKPMDIQSSIPVYLIQTELAIEEDTDEEIVQPKAPTADEIVSPPAHTGLSATVQNILSAAHSLSVNVLEGFFHLLGRFISFISDGFRSLINNRHEVFEFEGHSRGRTEPGPLRVPHYYAIRVRNKIERIVNIIIALSGTIFGGIHCICWAFAFPSQAERNIWRVCAILITIVPALGGAVFAITGAHLLSMYGTSALASGFRIMVPFYFAARLLLIVEAMITLRNLPNGAFDVVQWTTFIPHV